MQNLLNDLRNFRLSGIVNSLNDRLVYAQNNKLGFKEFLSLLCEDEKSHRKDNNYRRRKSVIAKIKGTSKLHEKGTTIFKIFYAILPPDLDLLIR